VALVGALDGEAEEHLTDRENLVPEIHPADVPDCPDRGALGLGLVHVHYCVHDHRDDHDHPDWGRGPLVLAAVGDRPFPILDARPGHRRNHLARPVRLARLARLARLVRLARLAQLDLDPDAWGGSADLDRHDGARDHRQGHPLNVHPISPPVEPLDGRVDHRDVRRDKDLGPDSRYRCHRPENVRQSSSDWLHQRRCVLEFSAPEREREKQPGALPRPSYE